MKMAVGCFGPKVFILAILASHFVLGGIAFPQYLNTTISSDHAVKNARFRSVEFVTVGFLGAWDYPDQKRLEKFAKAEVRRALPGIAFKGLRGADNPELGKARSLGQVLDIIIDVRLAWSPDTTRNYTGANVHVIFDVRKDGATETWPENWPMSGELADVIRTESDCVVSASRAQLTELVEKGIANALEVLANGFFESR